MRHGVVALDAAAVQPGQVDIVAAQPLGEPHVLRQQHHVAEDQRAQ